MNSYNRNTEKTAFGDYIDLNRNCGSFALDIQEWFYPYDDVYDEELDEFAGDRRNEIEDLFENGCSDYEVEEIIEKVCPWVERINKYDIKDSDRIVAYRVGIHYDDGVIDTDFHFRTRINGNWYEKNGSSNIKQIYGNETWNLGCQLNYYDSKTVYFRFKNK